jgi:hypothetical protein
MTGWQQILNWQGYDMKWLWHILMLPSHSLPGDAEGNHEYVRIADVWAEIQTQDFPSTK